MNPAARRNEKAQDVWLEGNVRLVRVPKFNDARGTLVPFEFDRLPFPPHRLFVVSDVPADAIRGRHALRDQRQLLICLTGQIDVDVRLEDLHQSITLDQPHAGLLIEPGVWHSLRFVVGGSVLLGLASGIYDRKGYETEDPDRVQ